MEHLIHRAAFTMISTNVFSKESTTRGFAGGGGGGGHRAGSMQESDENNLK